MEKKLKKKLKRQSLYKSFFFLILLGLWILIFLTIFEEDRLQDAFKERCIIETVEDVTRCQEENHYVTVKTNTIYTTDYVYTENNIEKAYYLDFDLNGYSLIGLVKKDLAEELLNQEGPYEVDGKIVDFEEDIEKGKNLIIEEYLQEATTDAEKEQILSMILTPSFDEYTGNVGQEYIISIIFGMLIIVTAYFSIKNIYFYIYPYKTKDLKKRNTKELEQLENEYNKVPPKQKHFITKNYLGENAILHVRIQKLDNILWIYERSIQQYGIETKRFLVLNNIDGDAISLSVNEQEKEQIIEKIMEKNPNLLIGYTKENKNKYKSMKKR